MKLLIGYDGSRSADIALDDLQKAGLPGKTEAVVLTVAEIWLPPSIHTEQADEYPPELLGNEWVEKHNETAQNAISEAKALSSYAKERLQDKFPDWTITSEAAVGSPARVILSKADEFNPDLIVVGSQGKNAVGRILLGSISQKVLAEAKCSVRVARGHAETEPDPHTRILIGFDGSPGANAAVGAVARRRWHDRCEIHLVTASNSLVPTSIGRFVPPVANWVEEDMKSERYWIKKLSEKAMHTLRNAGCPSELRIHNGNPKQVLVGEADELNADCIFLGANSFHNKLERFLIGSTSVAVATRAHCSVEVIRSNL